MVDTFDLDSFLKNQIVYDFSEENERSSNYKDILLYLDTVTDNNFLVLKCNNIDERSAVNRLAYLRGYSTKAIYHDEWIENFIYYCGNEGQKYFSIIEWEYDYEFVYYKFWDGDYYKMIDFDNNMKWRTKDLLEDEDVLGLDYNAVVVYPKYIKLVDDYKKRQIMFHKPNFKLPKGKQITTDELEKDLIDSIYQFKLEQRSSEYFICYDVRKVLLLRELVNKHTNVLDILKLLYSTYNES